MSKIFTIAALQHLPESTLRQLFAQTHQDLVRSKRGTPERRNAIASLENISRVLNRPRP